ncbi:MAG: acetyltransferase [Nitrospira sp.]|nr:MAG: acetyltransferase [Nitrospira sp.]
MIRKYQAQDLQAVIDIWYRASLIAHPFLDEAFLQAERQEIMEKHMPSVETWVYEKEGRIVGFIALLDCEVGAIFVDPQHQRQGIGRALMDHARKLRGHLELDVFKENHIGRAFYDRYGFKVVAEHLHESSGQLQLRLRLEDG